jgi:hypothetical protein
MSQEKDISDVYGISRYVSLRTLNNRADITTPLTANQFNITRNASHEHFKPNLNDRINLDISKSSYHQSTS